MSDGVVSLDAPSFKERLDRGDALTVLDVREDDERAYASIPLPPTCLDLHIPLAEVTGRFEEIREASAGRALVVYCHHGMRSMVAGTWLVRRGIGDVHNLDGGIDAWSTRVDPKVRRY